MAEYRAEIRGSAVSQWFLTNLGLVITGTLLVFLGIEAYRWAKDCYHGWQYRARVRGVVDRALDAGLRLEQDRFVDSFRTEDAVIGVASFLENGPGHAAFTGR